MLKKQFRLTEFNLNNYKSLSTPLFNLKYAKNDLSYSRFAFVVSKKIDTRATARNEIKRKLRSNIEQIFDNIVPGTDFIFYPSSKVLEGDSRQALENVLQGENLLK